MSEDADRSIAVGVPMFSRETALDRFLHSVPDYVRTAYVADNGESIDRDVYQQDWPFKLHVIDVEYDAGIGACRSAITDLVDEPYLWMGDNDMAFTADDDLRRLRGILEANESLGGIAGWLIEGSTVRAGARNLEMRDGTVIKSVEETPEMDDHPLPYTTFDFIPQACLFRTEVFDAYDYDASVGATEHLDFMLGHKQTQWEFASTPTVMIHHDRWINQEYRESKRGQNHSDLEITREKWGVEAIVPGNRADWGYARSRTIPQQGFDVIKRVTPPRVWLPIRRAARVVGLA